MERDRYFKEYIEAFKTLPLSKKKEMLLSETKKTLGLAESLKEVFEIKSDILYNKELTDFKSGDVSEEDLVEAIFVYIYSIRESFAESFNKIIKTIANEEVNR